MISVGVVITPATKSLLGSETQSPQAPQPGILVVNPTVPHINEDRKFNAAIFGIKECPQKTPRDVRQQTDLDALNGAFHDAKIQVDDNLLKTFFVLVNSSLVTRSLGQSWSNF